MLRQRQHRCSPAELVGLLVLVIISRVFVAMRRIHHEATHRRRMYPHVKSPFAPPQPGLQQPTRSVVAVGVALDDEDNEELSLQAHSRFWRYTQREPDFLEQLYAKTSLFCKKLFAWVLQM